MATDERDPAPGRTPGLQPGGGVQPGETPPNADQLSGASGDRQRTPNKGPGTGNRTPMIIGIVFVGLITLMVVIFGFGLVSSWFTEEPISGETGTQQPGAEPAD